MTTGFAFNITPTENASPTNHTYPKIRTAKPTKAVKFANLIFTPFSYALKIF